MNPESIVQRQLEAYNAHDLEGLVASYAPKAQLFDHTGAILAEGEAQLRDRFAVRFQETNLHARLFKRMVMGRFVVDHEQVTRTFPEGTGSVELIATYEVIDGKIAKAWFLSGPIVLDAPAP